LKLAMINICLRPDAVRRQLPVGFGYVLTALRRAGVEFDLIDMDINVMSMEELELFLNAGQYDAIGMGCIVTGFRSVREIASLAKEIRHDTVIFAGNSVATSIPELLLRNTDVDIAVIGEGELTVVELVRALEEGRDLRDVAGLGFLHDDAFCLTAERSLLPSLDAIGYPDWDIFDLEKYNKYASININQFSKESVLSYPLSTARGCPYNCTFCYHVFKGKKYRRYSDECIIGEIIRLHDRYRCDFVSFWDELSFPNLKTLERFITALDSLDFMPGWDAPCRAGLFRKEHLPLVRELKAHGCDNLAFSLENADPKILKAMDKRISVESFIEQCHVLQEGGVIPLTSVIFGYPQETSESIAKTLEVCRQCNIFPSVGFLLPLPGTPIYQWCLDTGKITDEVEYLMGVGDRQDFHINITEMPTDQLVGEVSDGLKLLASDMGLNLPSVFKTGTYQSPLAGKKEKPLA